MKRFYTAAIIFIILAFGFILSFSWFYIIDGGLNNLDDSSKITESAKKPEYHFVVIAQSTDDPFWQSVKKGAFEAAKEFGAAVEFNGPRFTNIEEELQYLDIAIASKVDGIATHVLNEGIFTPIIDKAAAMDIPVITIDSDAKKSKRLSFIGTNSFQIGSVAGRLITEATGGKANVAVILNSYRDEEGHVSQNLIITGLKGAVEDLQNDIDINEIRMSSMGIFSAGEITNEIINNYPEINAIFCTNAKDTVGAAQVVVDLNRVGQISIVGYGDLPEIWRYIEKEVIYGTVASDPVNMGYESIKSLVEIKKKKTTSSYVDTGVYGVTKSNLDEFLKKSEIENEQESLND